MTTEETLDLLAAECAKELRGIILHEGIDLGIDLLTGVVRRYLAKVCPSPDPEAPVSPARVEEIRRNDAACGEHPTQLAMTPTRQDRRDLLALADWQAAQLYALSRILHSDHEAALAGECAERGRLLADVADAKRRAVASWDHPHESSPGEVVCDLLEARIAARGAAQTPHHEQVLAESRRMREALRYALDVLGREAERQTWYAKAEELTRLAREALGGEGP